MRKDVYYAKDEKSTHNEFASEWCGEDADYWRRYFALVDGLDGSSTEIVNTILSRLKYVFNSNNDEIDFFTEEEKAEMEDIENKLLSKIFFLKEGLYVYKNYYLPKNYYEPIAYYYGYYLNEFKNQERIRKGNILDGGAYIGDTSVFFSKITTGKVFSWEPIDKNVNYIKETIRLNKANNIEVVNKALGSKREMGIVSTNNESNLSTLMPYTNREYIEEKIIIQTIDDFVKERDETIDVIKLHVEGAEYNSVIGAKKTLERYRPILMIHIHHNPRDFFEIKPLIESLDLGYSFKIVKPINRKAVTGTLLLGECI